MHNGNFGDELNVDIGVVLLGDQMPHTKLLLVRRGRGDRRTITSEPKPLGFETRLWTTVSANMSGKILAIGSTLNDVKLGDVVMGIGAKAFRQQIGYSDHAVVLPVAEEAMRHNSTILAALRGPRTCHTLARKQLPVACGSMPYGDPALVGGLLLPWWKRFHWMPAKRVGMTPLLCLVPQMSDVGGRHLGFIEAYRSPCRRASSTLIRLVNPISSKMRPNAFAKALLTCDLVAASALHGIIAADALRVPSVWFTNLTELSMRNMSGWQGNKESPFKCMLPSSRESHIVANCLTQRTCCSSIARGLLPHAAPPLMHRRGLLRWNRQASRACQLNRGGDRTAPPQHATQAPASSRRTAQPIEALRVCLPLCPRV